MSKRTLCVLGIMSLTVGLLGCVGSSSEQVSTTVLSEDEVVLDIATSEEDVVMLTGEVRLRIFSSDRHYHDQQQNEVMPALLDFVNSGLHAIVAVKTVYSSKGVLLKAEVYYKAVSPPDLEAEQEE